MDKCPIFNKELPLNISSEEILSETILFQIQNQVIDLNYAWKLYSQIYRENFEADVYSISPTLFSFLHFTLEEKIVITICRLFDKPCEKYKNRNKGFNIGFPLLIDTLKKENNDPKLVDTISKMVDLVKKENNSLTNFRNKLLAHNDYNFIINQESAKIIFSPFQPSEIEITIKFINSFTNSITDLLSPHLKSNYKIDFEGVNCEGTKLMSLLKRAVNQQNNNL